MSNQEGNLNDQIKAKIPPVISCKGYCSKHNPLRSISYTSHGAYLSGMWAQCYCDCQPCLEREIAIDAEFAYAEAEIQKMLDLQKLQQ